MLGIVGFILITSAGVIVGENAVLGLKKRENELRELSGLMARIDIYLTSCCLDTTELFGRISSEGGCYDRLFSSVEEDITESISYRIRTSGLEMCDVLADHIAKFGCTDLDGQLAQNALIRCDVDAALEDACKRRIKYTGIYRAVGVSAGLTTALLMI